MTRWVSLLSVVIGLTACTSLDVAGYNNDDPRLGPIIQEMQTGDYDNAIKTLRPLVRNGNPAYEHYLGLALVIQRGDTVRKQKNATVSSNANAAMLELTEHSMRNPDDGTKEGILLLTSSANKGYGIAQHTLGWTIISAQDTASEKQPNFNMLEAIKWFILADRGGNADARKSLKLFSWLAPDSDMKAAYVRANSWKLVQWYNTQQNSPAEGASDASKRLRKLKKLYEDGLITEDEYVQKKKEIIGEL